MAEQPASVREIARIHDLYVYTLISHIFDNGPIRVKNEYREDLKGYALHWDKADNDMIEFTLIPHDKRKAGTVWIDDGNS